MDSVKLDRFFATINAELNAYDRFKALVAPQLAPDFNIFSCLYPDENRLSAVIAMLLDPNGEHGQGEIFLNLFFDVIENEASYTIQCETVKLLRQGLEKGYATKTLEAATDGIENSLRRIDILFDIGGVGLAIENKPWACDQDKQIEDYVRHLENKNLKPYLLIYLSGNGGPPGQESLTTERREELEKSGNFLILSYRSLRNWVALCVEKCQSSRVRSFLEDFDVYITNEFDGGLPAMEKEIVVEQATKKENIEAVLSIQLAWPEIATKLIEILAELVMKQIETKCGQYGPWEMKVDFTYWEPYTGFYFYRKDSWAKYRLRFMFEASNANSCCCGVEKFEECKEDSDDIMLASKLDCNYIKQGYPNSHWVFWEYLKVPNRDWKSSADPWTGIYDNGLTVNTVASIFERIIDCVAEDIDKIEIKLST